MASHDLQEPLRKIVGFAELLGQRYPDELDQEARSTWATWSTAHGGCSS